MITPQPGRPTWIDGLRIDRLVTSGTFSLDGQTFDVDNNVWILGDDEQCVVVDAAHDADAIIAAVGDRRCTAVLCTHAHDDHVDAAPAVRAALGAPIYLHPADDVLWRMRHPDVRPDEELSDGQRIRIAGTELSVLHTPGHAPGAVCYSIPEAGVLLSGDTLFQGGPGATGRSFSDFPTILDSIADRLLVLPPETTVLTGHGDATSIGAEAPQLDEWRRRGN